MLTMLLLEMISELLAAISKKVTLEHFKTPQVLRCLDACKRVYSLPDSRHATFLFLFNDSISISIDKLYGRFKMYQILR